MTPTTLDAGQLGAIFQNISTAAAKVATSNDVLQSSIHSASMTVAGLLLAVIVAIAWKG